MDAVEKVVMKRAQEKKWLKKLEQFDTGDTVKVFVKIKEGEKERTQIFRGVVIKLQGTGFSRTFTVRKISSGVGVERTFPVASPNLEKVEVVNRGKVRRGRLYFLRDLAGRAARLDSELVISEGDATSADTSAEVTAAAATDAAASTEPKAPSKSALKKAAKKEAAKNKK